MLLEHILANEKLVNEALKDLLLRSCAEVNKMKEKYILKDLRTAAMTLAVKRVTRAIKLRGIFP